MHHGPLSLDCDILVNLGWPPVTLGSLHQQKSKHKEQLVGENIDKSTGVVELLGEISGQPFNGLTALSLLSFDLGDPKTCMS